MIMVHLKPNNTIHFVYDTLTGTLSRFYNGELTPYPPSSQGYIQVRYQGKTVQAGHIIMMMHGFDNPDNLELDHIDRNPLNNRIDNLRFVTRSENALNTVRTKSLHPGVSKFGETYRAYTDIGKRRYHGTYNTLSEAVAAREKYLASYGTLSENKWSNIG